MLSHTTHTHTHIVLYCCINHSSFFVEWIHRQSNIRLLTSLVKLDNYNLVHVLKLCNDDRHHAYTHSFRRTIWIFRLASISSFFPLRHFSHYNKRSIQSTCSLAQFFRVAQNACKEISKIFVSNIILKFLIVK